MNFNGRCLKLEEFLGYGKSFDVVKKEMILSCGRSAVYYYINGFSNGVLTEQIHEFILSNKAEKDSMPTNAYQYAKQYIPYGECTVTDDFDKAVYFVLSGAAILIIDGYSEYIIVDTRNYPKRDVGEPANDRVLRGPREGFVEALVPNIGLIRRRIRDSRLRIEKLTVGKSTKTDVAICYLEDTENKELIHNIKKRLNNANLDAVNMGLESISEVIAGGKWYNPFPRVRYTERPDAACSMILEGSVILVCDNYPSTIILPTSFFDFSQDTDDFYFTPFVGGYLKLVRLFVYGFSLIITPIWYLLILNPDVIPQWLDFIIPSKEYHVPVLLQLLSVEICIDGLKLASLNTPDTMSNSLGIIGGLLLGDFAVNVGWLSNEVIFYMAFVAIANFTQPSYEMSYALKFMRMLSLVLIALFGLIGLSLLGFILGFVITVFLIVKTPVIPGAKGYLYPLIPWNKKALFRLIFRVSLKANKNKM